MSLKRTLLPLLSLAVVTLATAGCHGRTPTEPASFDDDSTALASTAGASSLSGAAEESTVKRGGADDPAGHVRGGGDDPAGDDHGGRDRGGNTNPNPTARAPRPTAQPQFAGAVRTAGGGTLTLANGTRIAVNAQTRWDARGDLFTLAQVASSVAAHRPTRVEGRGTRQADGSLVAATIKAEVD